MMIKLDDSILLAQNEELQSPDYDAPLPDQYPQDATPLQEVTPPLDQSLLNSANEGQQNTPAMTNDPNAPNAHRTETRKTSEEFQASAVADTSLLGIDLEILSITSFAVNIILLLVAFLFCLSKISRLEDFYNILNKNFNAQKEKIDNLPTKLSSLEGEISSMKSRIQSENLNRSLRPAEVRNFSELSFDKPPAPPRVITLEDKCRDFVKAFNALTGQSGYNAREAKEDFVKKYNVQAFSCVNHEARMSDPIPPPEFSSVPSVHKGEFWAYEVEAGVYAVVPNVKTYADNYHKARAAGEIFKSNFVKGNTYNKIRVNKAAIFRGMWKFDSFGELELS